MGGGYNGSLGTRRYEGFESQHANSVEAASSHTRDRQREQRQASRAPRIAGVAPARPPHRAIEGAHLKPGVVTLSDVIEEYTASLREAEDLPTAS